MDWSARYLASVAARSTVRFKYKPCCVAWNPDYLYVVEGSHRDHRDCNTYIVKPRRSINGVKYVLMTLRRVTAYS